MRPGLHLARVGGLIGIVLLANLAAGVEPEKNEPEKKSPPQVVYLGRSSSWALTSGGAIHTGRFAREIVRQAILIAARDELQLLTRDYWLDELPPVAGNSAQLDVIGSAGNPSLIEVVQGRPGVQELLWQHEIALPSTPFDYRDWTSRLETLSRTQFVEVLGRAGFQARPSSGRRPAAKRDELDRWLNSLSFTSQYYAVRALHGQLATQGESSTRLAGLARGYAHLGVLCEYFWHPMHEVFKARAMLYAERLVARDDWSANALAHRGYVCALVGLPGAALDDLSWAKTTSEKKSAKAAPLPDWVNLVESFCRFDPAGIQTKDPRYAQLAALLRLIAAEQSGVRGLAPEVASVEVGNAPECYRICDGFMFHYGNENPDESLPLPPNGESTLAGTLGPRLSELPGLPATIARLLPQAAKGKTPAAAAPSLCGDILSALLAADSLQGPARQSVPSAAPDELPWSVLGRMLEEVSFYQAWRQLRPDLGRHADAEVARLLPGVPQHRYRGFLEMSQTDPTAHRRGYHQLLTRRDLEMLEPGDAPLIFHITTFKSLDPEGFVIVLRERMNLLAREIMFQGADPRGMLRINPFCPWARATMASGAWTEVAELAADWETSSANYPHVLAAIGRQWTATGKLEDAERILNKAYRLDASAANARAIADLLERQGKRREQIEMLKTILTLPDVADADQVQAQVAAYYMAEGDWTAASKYADQAAEHGTAVGQLIAAEVSEARQDWVAAEKLFRQLAEPLVDQPYSAEWIEWLAFCKRTGQGDELAAHEHALRCLQRFEPWQKDAPPVNKKLLVSLTCYLLLQQMDKALAICDEAFQGSQDPFYGLQAALISDRQGDAQRRDRSLAAVVAQQSVWAKAHPEQPRLALFGLAARIIEDLGKQAESSLGVKEVRKIGAQATEDEQIDLYYFAGDYLLQHGKPKLGMEMLEECMIRLPIRSTSRTLAGKALWDRSVTPNQYADRLRNRSAVAKRPAKP